MFLRNDEAHYRLYGSHKKDKKVRDYTGDWEAFREEMWQQRMPAHVKERQQRSQWLAVSRPHDCRRQDTQTCPGHGPNPAYARCTCGQVDLVAFLSPSPMSNYYCFPPVHTDLNWTAETSVGFWLVTDMGANNPGPGIYTSWESCLRAIDGRPNAEGIFYPTHEATFPAWQTRCRQGWHNHPVNPNFRPKTPPAIALENVAVPPFVPFSGPLQNFAVLGGNITYTTIYPAMAQYLRLARQPGGVQLLATSDHTKAVFFSLGHEEFAAEQLAAASDAATPGGVELPFTPTPQRTKPTAQRKPVPTSSSSSAPPRAPAPSKAPRPGPPRARPAETTERDRQAASRARLMAIEASLKDAKINETVPHEDFAVNKGKAKAKAKRKADATESDFYFDSDNDFALMDPLDPLVVALEQQKWEAIVSPRAEGFDPRFENHASD
ncbi:hypothetical protein C8R46DRAFT_1036066 [Mycena filopes]|nr:hypothetical protein C8R46DRAFT_1036066 [Mycena filopes]